MAQFIKYMAGPESYEAGGFEFAVGEYEKIQHANVEMHPDTILGTTVVPGFTVDLVTDKAAATIGVYNRSGDEAWAEAADGTDLSAATFILSGEAV